METIFKRTHVAANRGTSTYQSENGLTLNAPKSFLGGQHPETITLVGLPDFERVAKEKKPTLTKEERKALRDALTPEQKVQAAKDRAEKATKRANELAAKLAAPAAQ